MMANQRQVLYVTYDGLTDPLGQSQVLPYLVGLSKFGYQISIISCEKPERYRQQREVIEKITSSSNITWHPLPYTKKPPVISTINDVRKLRKKAVELYRTNRFELVHCRSYVGSLVGIYLKKKFSIKYLFDMRGFWPNEKVDAGSWNLKNPLYKTVYSFFKRMERIFLQHADHIISLTHRGVEVMQGWQHARLDIKKVSVIPCCVDTDLFDATRIDPVQKDKLAIELSIQAGDVIVSYLGSIGTWYMLEEMLDFFCVFKKQFPLSRFLFITHDEHEHIINTALIKGLSKNDLILRGAARSEVPALLSLTSYSLFFIRPTYSKAASSPTKQGELMAMGMPVICNAGVGDTDIIVNKFHSGVLVEQFTDDDYERAIKAITSSVFSAGGIRAGALDYFALEKGVSKYQEIYKKLLSS